MLTTWRSSNMCSPGLHLLTSFISLVRKLSYRLYLLVKDVKGLVSTSKTEERIYKHVMLCDQAKRVSLAWKSICDLLLFNWKQFVIQGEECCPIQTEMPFFREFRSGIMTIMALMKHKQFDLSAKKCLNQWQKN